MSADSQPTGTQPLQAPLGHFDSLAFIIQQALSKVQTATVVRVEKCTNSGGLEPVGFVDVTPLVNQVDNEGNAVPHVTIFGLPYCRIQGGANAVIIDPEPGDIGIAVFASRDISKVKATKDQANPGSFRQFNFADGMYLGGLLNAEPSQYIQFNAAGIRVYSPAKVEIIAPSVVVNAENSCSVTTKTATVTASVIARITAPAIKLGSAGQSLKSFVTSVFVDLFNSHSHMTPSGESDPPTQQMGGDQLTTTVEGG